jgi:phage repressor protein C with HTH and peptisase S24 domain
LDFETSQQLFSIFQKKMQPQSFQRLVTARKALRLSLREFAEPLGRGYSAVNHWEKGEAPITPMIADAIEKHHNISASWLLTGEGEMLADVSKDDAVDDLVDVHLLSARPCAGNGNALEDYIGQIGSMSFSKRWLRKAYRVAPENLLLMEVAVDSMIPTILPYEMVFVDASPFQDFQREGVWVLRIADTLRVKRVQWLNAVQPQAVSDNSAYSPILLDETAQLMGRVVGQPQRFF